MKSRLETVPIATPGVPQSDILTSEYLDPHGLVLRAPSSVLLNPKLQAQKVNEKQA